MSARVHQSGTSFPAAGRGRVFSSHEKALNLEVEGEPELATLVTEEQMMTVSSLLVSTAPADLRLARIERGCGFEIHEGQVGFDSGLTLVLEASAAGHFTGRIDAMRDASEDRPLAGGPLADDLFAAIAEEAGSVGFAPLAVAARGGPPYPSEPPGTDPFARAAWKVVHPILVGEVEPEELLGNAFSLVGLGGGFTPSGDDFLVGMLAARAVLGEPSPAGPALERLLKRCGSTTLPGATIVRQALRGCYPAYLCRFARDWGAMAVGDRLDAGSHPHDGANQRIRDFVAAAARHGHSSGIDAVTGFGFGMLWWG